MKNGCSFGDLLKITINCVTKLTLTECYMTANVIEMYKYGK